MIDPVTLAVIRGRLEQIVDEMDATLFRAAFSPVIAEARDGSHGLYDAATGDTIAMGKTGLPVFIGAMSHAAKAAIKRAEADGGFQDGHVILLNDPYDGATHLNDIKLIKPLFRDGRPFCLLASVGHWIDVGGNAPIGMATMAPVEILESLYPIRFTNWGLRPDSGGAGRHRGGLGAIYEIELMADAATLVAFGERAVFPAFGVLGGGAGAVNRLVYDQDDGPATPRLGAKLPAVRLTRGQRVRIESPGLGAEVDRFGNLVVKLDA